jgi:S1-C subfamily serine protease
MMRRGAAGILVGAVLATSALGGCGTSDHWGDATAAANSPAKTRAEHGGVLAGGEVTEGQWRRSIARARAATFEVFNSGCAYDATGSAVVIDDSTLLTNRHVVEGAREMHVISPAGVKVPVTSWDVSSVDDLAVLHVGSSGGASLALASDGATGGDLVAALGYPLGGPLTVGRGRVVDFDDLDTGHQMIRASMDILPGNSGGPLIDTSGHLVGLIRAIDLVNGWALAVPLERVSRAIEGNDLFPGRPCQES